MLETNIPMDIPKSRTKYHATGIVPEPIEEKLEHRSVFHDKVKEFEYQLVFDSNSEPSEFFRSVKW